MDTQEFIKNLNRVQGLLSQEKYQDAITILEKLKEIEKKGDFDYSLTHKLYQLDSNSRSLMNQQIIAEILKKVSEVKKSITFNELNQKLREEKDILLELDILKREIEILILRGVINSRIENDRLIF